jgi:hypothetical protein
MIATRMSLMGLCILVPCTSPMLEPFRVLQAPAEVFPALAARLGRG